MEDVLVAEQINPVAPQEQVPLTRENFWEVSTDDLMDLRKIAAEVTVNNDARLTSAQLLEAEQLYQESSLELFFRRKGENYRHEYDKWLEMKQKKQKEWEQYMQAKYGEEWEHQVTEADRKLFTYSFEEMKIYARHKAIETEAMQVEKNDREKKKNEEKEAYSGSSKKDFFKLVEARTLKQYQFLGPKEVHNVVYSIDFLFFHMKQIARSMVRKGFNRMRGNRVPELVELERNLNEAASFVRDITVQNRMLRI